MGKEPQVFADRTAAGRELARVIGKRNLQRPLLVLGLPRGGVPVAFEVARALRAPLDVIVVRKIGMPGQPEFAIGAVASGGVTFRTGAAAGLYEGVDLPFEQLAERERLELARREQAYRPGAPPIQAQGKTAILVDDGLATGATMIAAVRAARRSGAAAVVAAAPVASGEAAAAVAAEADDVIFVQTSESLFAISQWYLNFEQVDDAEICALLERARRGEFISDVA